MTEYKLKLLAVGELGENCYLLYHTDTFEAVIIDPGADEDRIITEITGLGLKPCAILLTHGHFDHIGAVDHLRKRYNIRVYASEAEKELLADESQNLTADFVGGFTLTADEWLEDRQLLSLAGFQMEVLSTPGHTPGSICFYLKKENILFSGDTLFAGSIGRIDFPGGSASKMKHSIRDVLLKLPAETVVFPGHGEQTDISYEQKYNPFA